MEFQLRNIYVLESTSKVFSIFTPKTDVQWHEFDTVMIGQYLMPDGKIESRSKIAAFDLVGICYELLIHIDIVCLICKPIG